MGVENRMAAQENQIEGVKNGLMGLENRMEGKLREIGQQSAREIKQMGEQIEEVKIGVETKLDAQRDELGQMRVASTKEREEMKEEIRRGVSEVSGVREEVKRGEKRMEKEVRNNTARLQGGIEDLTEEVEQLTVGQTELVEQVQKNTAVLGGLKATQRDIKDDLIATQRQCQMVREGLTMRLEEVTEVMETKDREVRTHIETVKIALEDELEETHREIKEVKQKLEEVEEEVSEIKKRRTETKREIQEEVMEYVQGRCSTHNCMLTNQIKSLQVAKEVRRRGAKVSGDIRGNVHDVRGASVGLGVDLDPGVRERPLVKCATGTVCEGGGVRECPTLGCVRKKGTPRSECAVESESVVARVRGSTWKRVVGSVTKDVTEACTPVVSVTEEVTGEDARERCVTDGCMGKECAVKSKGECTPVVSVTEDVTGECAQEDARERCVTDGCMREECAVKSKGECATECGGESSESDVSWL
uniref:probable DNA double-strand break repair Rad50 ATPase n=1 Tax=Myxine glutinosa TaxID=7769 RepID=UPI00358F031A